MTESVTLQIPANLAQKAKELAQKQQQSFEDTLIDLISQGVAASPLTLLSDKKLLEVCALQMDNQQQDNLYELLAKQKENTLGSVETEELERLMQIYRHGMVQKARAIRLAVERGIMQPLGAD